MASRLDQALDEAIKDRRGNNKRPSNFGRNTRRDNGSSGGAIRKRIGAANSSPAIRSFVRTVNVMEERRGGGARNVDGQWSHDMFDDEDVPRSSILSRLGTARGGQGGRSERGVEICVENLHYNVTEQDVKELFNTVADVTKAKLMFDPSGRSTGLAYISYQSLSDAEKAIQKYNNIELDGQPMQIKISERAASRPRSSGGSRFNNDRLSNRLGGRLGSSSSGRRSNDRNDRDDYKRASRPSRSSRGNDKREDRQKKVPTAEDLDREMESYMKSNSSDNSTSNNNSNVNNNSTATLEEDIEMMLD
ncbi:major facilitator superfamily transporter protein [Mucor velutinosus]|uniref:Major facilitator superfamily transporter protein n=1 Tax=Mucor velutinosus TaxID=708070 RepID=A0AAN7DIZ3_9FUNG|nr:major facilitator superfamily transporter protein [Mucor velutinosus]